MTRTGIAGRREQRFFATAYRRATMPPPPAEWGRFGRALVVPPVRVSNADCVFLGDGVIVLENCWMSVVRAFDDTLPRLELRDGVRVGRGCQFSVAGSVTVGARTTVGDFVQIGDTYHPVEDPRRIAGLRRPEPVTIGERVVIGSNAVVLPGVTVGDGAVIDHLAVVTRDVPAGMRVRGVPARPA